MSDVFFGVCVCVLALWVAKALRCDLLTFKVQNLVEVLRGFCGGPQNKGPKIIGNSGASFP